MEFGDSGEGGLAAQLDAVGRRIARKHPAYTAAAEAFIRRLQEARAGSAAPAVGEPMPDFLLPDARGGLVSLAAFAGRPLVLSFLRGHWCDFCETHAAALASVEGALTALGAQVAIVTPERLTYAEALVAAAPGFRLICDLDNGYAASLGLLAAIDGELAQRLTQINIDPPTYQGSRGWAVPIPATFVLDGDGRVVDRALDPDYRRRPSLAWLLDAARRAAAIDPR